ncbi:hypothetical protein CCAX7_41400 [Capsulimonas corticalis]|uniref:Uncharacterized protein n=1 Tax=Capsulimonas corticalis TaxID=2219043 RepID=A0A402CY12_9BACT|nr:DUF5696 domain-containing protein [Capsulimonas corticalis]BDI32089.1 hypothetical protein CCAX7_41400 [Capsulimonas corticalis]
MHTIQDDSLRVHIYQENGEVLAEVSDLRSGAVWGPAPAFTLEVYSILLRRTETMPAPEARIAQGDDWIDVTLGVDNQFFSASATARFSLDQGELVVEIPSDRVQEGRPETSLLSGLHVLPNLLSTSPEAPGHLVLPYRVGALCFPERHSRHQENFLIYGEQHQWELMPMLPACGAVRERESSAMLLIADQGDCDTECRVATDGVGGGQVSFSMRYHYTRIDPVDPIDRRLRFAPLRGEDANYAGMGRRLNAHVFAKAGRGTLLERAEANPDIAYASKSLVLKIMHGCKDIGSITGSGRFHLATTCEQAMEQLSLLKHSGFERVMVQLTGWNLEGHDGCWPTRFPVEPAIGGEEGLRELIAHGQSLGFQMQVHDNYLDLYERSYWFDPELCTGDVYGGPLKRGCWAGGINYIGWPLAYPDTLLGDQMREVQKLGPAGIYYLDAMGLPLEISYNRAHGERRYRRACADGVARILRASREVFGSAGTENGYLYCAAECDYIGSPFLDLFGEPVSEMIDQMVPLWFMAMKGHIFTNLHDTYNAVVDKGDHSPITVAHRMLKMAELGLLPRNEGVAVRGDWGYPLEETIEAMRLEYDLMTGPLAETILASLVDHRVMAGDPEKNDHITYSRFSSGVETVCDYKNGSLEINGQKYPLPKDFAKRPEVARGARSPLAAEAWV